MTKKIFIDITGTKKVIDETVDVELKVQNYLSAEDFILYKNAFDLNIQLWDNYLSQGLYSVETEYENIYIPELDESIDVDIGSKNVIGPGVDPSQLQLHPEYLVWFAKLPRELFDYPIID